MHDQMLRDLLRRLNALERTAARVRVGEVTDVTPLDVALGGSDTSYDDVKAVDGVALAATDQVATLLWGNDLIVLGEIGAGGRFSFGTASLTWPGSNVISNFSASIAHGLPATPTGVLIVASSQASTGPVFAWREAVTSTTFTFRASTGPSGFQPTNGTSQSFAWQAFI